MESIGNGFDFGIHNQGPFVCIFTTQLQASKNRPGSAVCQGAETQMEDLVFLPCLWRSFGFQIICA
jgi:hypothetical protein